MYSEHNSYEPLLAEENEVEFDPDRPWHLLTPRQKLMKIMYYFGRFVAVIGTIGFALASIYATMFMFSAMLGLAIHATLIIAIGVIVGGICCYFVNWLIAESFIPELFMRLLKRNHLEDFKRLSTSGKIKYILGFTLVVIAGIFNIAINVAFGRNEFPSELIWWLALPAGPVLFLGEAGNFFSVKDNKPRAEYLGGAKTFTKAGKIIAYINVFSMCVLFGYSAMGLLGTFMIPTLAAILVTFAAAFIASGYSEGLLYPHYLGDLMGDLAVALGIGARIDPPGQNNSLTPIDPIKMRIWMWLAQPLLLGNAIAASAFNYTAMAAVVTLITPFITPYLAVAFGFIGLAVPPLGFIAWGAALITGSASLLLGEAFMLSKVRQSLTRQAEKVANLPRDTLQQAPTPASIIEKRPIVTNHPLRQLSAPGGRATLATEQKLRNYGIPSRIRTGGGAPFKLPGPIRPYIRQRPTEPLNSDRTPLMTNAF